MMTEHSDVLIVGGGPAGTLAALSIRQLCPDLSVTLVDAEVFPRDKACGDAVGPTSVRLLRDLGLEDEIFHDSELVNAGRVIGPAGIDFVAEFVSTDNSVPYGYIQRRTVFDARLIYQCGVRGVKVLQGVKAEHFQKNDSGWTVSLVDGSRGEVLELSTSLLIGADGASSRIRKHLDIPNLHGKSRALAVRAYAAWEPGAVRLRKGELLVVYEPSLFPFYGWVFPLPDDQVNLGVGYLEVDKVAGASNLKSNMERFLRLLEAKGFRFGEPHEISSHILPLGNHRLAFSGDSVVLVGDAAGMINPLSGEGIAYAATAAEILAQELSKLGISQLRSGLLNGLEKRYETRFRNHYKGHFQSNFLATRALSRPIVGKAIFRAASRKSAVRSYGVELMFGDAKFNVRAILMVLGGLIGKERDVY